jgi:hypothetical protein
VASARLALTNRDFDQLAASRRSPPDSTLGSRPRSELKRRALGWAKKVVARLAEIGLAVEAAGSDEFASLRNGKSAPSQWIWIGRDRDARAEVERVLDAGRALSAPIEEIDPHQRHAVLVLRLDAHGIEVGFSIAPEARVDLENLRGRVDAGAGEVVAALEALPGEFVFGADATATERCSAASAGRLQGLADEGLLGRGGFWVGWRVARDVAVEHADLLEDQLADALVALAPIYRLVGWSRDNDLIARDRSRKPTPRPQANASIAGSGAGRSGGGSVEKGARVRVRSGPFADKVGTVSELDGRGALVMLGLLSSRFTLGELEPVVEGRDRKTFQSSHRRPIPPAPRKAR